MTKHNDEIQRAFRALGEMRRAIDSLSDSLNEHRRMVDDLAYRTNDALFQLQTMYAKTLLSNEKVID